MLKRLLFLGKIVFDKSPTAVVEHGFSRFEVVYRFYS